MNQGEMITEIHRHTKEIARNTEQIDLLATEVQQHTIQLNTVHLELLDHRRRLEWLEENVFTKKDAKKMMDALDYLVGEFKRMEIEGYAATEWLKRHESRIEKLETHAGLA